MDTDTLTMDTIEQRLREGEAAIARIRHAQMVLLREADRRQVRMTDGCRTLTEWVTGRLDVASETANRLVSTARRLETLPNVDAAARDGVASFDRIWATAKSAVVGDDDAELLNITWRHSVDGLARMRSRRHRMSRGSEREAFRRRYVMVQPNLDESSWRLYGQLPAVAGKTLIEALDTRTDELGDGRPESRTTRWADALWSISLDSLRGSDGTTVESTPPLLTVFLDATDAAATGGEAGAWIEGGPRVGPDTIEAMLCDGVVEVTARTPDGRPLAMGRRSRTIPPRLKRFVLARDDGCTIAGCTSRYRLQPHHITPWSEGGVTDPDNLTTLCWYHHHVVIHGRGFSIDPDSPPQRRWLQQPAIHAPPR